MRRSSVGELRRSELKSDNPEDPLLTVRCQDRTNRGHLGCCMLYRLLKLPIVIPSFEIYVLSRHS